jgi:MFS family permease
MTRRPSALVASRESEALTSTIQSPCEYVSPNPDEALCTYPQQDSQILAENIRFHFIVMSILFSCNHGCVVSCLGLATARLGSLGAGQSGMLYLSYTLSGLLGSTYVVKRLGSRDALIAGMGAYIAYVGCFWLASILLLGGVLQGVIVYLGALIGGIGAGFLWTAQGSYLSSAAQQYAHCSRQCTTLATSKLAGIFAFFYLALEVILKVLSTALLQAGFVWSTIFEVYAFITALSAILMVFVPRINVVDPAGVSTSTTLYKVTAAWQLLITDPKMKYMIGLNAVFGFSAAFINSYVNGEVVRVVLQDDQSKYIGIMTAGMSALAALMSLFFTKVTKTTGKGPILLVGALCFGFVALPFLIFPGIENWNWMALAFVYAMQGTGRSTFEGTLKATFADYFAYEKEGAFANIILQNGLASSLGYLMSFTLSCRHPNKYCVEYKDGSLHDMLSFELLIIVTALIAIVGYWRASLIYKVGERVSELNQQFTETSVLTQLHADEDYGDDDLQ